MRISTHIPHALYNEINRGSSGYRFYDSGRYAIGRPEDFRG